MVRLNDKDILLTYHKAIELELDREFIELLENEIQLRGLFIKKNRNQRQNGEKNTENHSENSTHQG